MTYRWPRLRLSNFHQYDRCFVSSWLFPGHHNVMRSTKAWVDFRFCDPFSPESWPISSPRFIPFMSRLPGDTSACFAHVAEQGIGLIFRWEMASCHPFQQQDEIQGLTDPLHPQPGTPLLARTGNSDLLLHPSRGTALPGFAAVWGCRLKLSYPLNPLSYDEEMSPFYPSPVPWFISTLCTLH